MESERGLPEGWSRVTLADVCQKVPNVKPEDEPEREFGYVDISAISNTTFTIGETKRFLGKDAPSRARRPIEPGDVLFSTVRTYLRNIAMVHEGLDATLCSTGFTVLRSNGAVVPQYLFHYTLSEEFINAVTPQQTGTQYPATSDRVVFSTSIPLPPFAEQRRIVARFEALLADLERVRGRLEAVAATMLRFRQAVFAAAYSGRLTEGWRTESPDFQNESGFFKAIVEESGREKSNNQIRIGLESHESAQLPRTWIWATLEQITENFDGRRVPVKSDDRKKRRGPYPYYGASGIIDTIDKFLFDGEYLLIGEDGANLVMRSTPIAFQATGKFWVNNHAHVLKTLGGIPLQFLEGYINSIDLRQYVTGSAQPKLTQANMNKIPIHLPPLTEQHEIVRRVEALFALADRIEGEVAGARERVEALTQAILAKAFRGELVPTEAELARREGREYEPAGMLLERVQAGREDGRKQPATRGRRRAGQVTLPIGE